MKTPVRPMLLLKLLCIAALLFVLFAVSAVFVYAQDEPPYITVRFAPSPGSFENSANHVMSGRFGFRIDAFPEPEAPEGYVFIGWFSNGTHMLPPIANIRNTTLLAAYAPIQDPNNTTGYVIVYDPGAGQLPAGASSVLALTYGSALMSLPTPFLEGYSFSGWEWEEEKITAPFIVRGDMILEAVWVPASGVLQSAIQSTPIEIPENQFVIALNPFPGVFEAGENGLRFARSATAIRPMPEAPTRRGAVFAGWKLPCGRMLESTSIVREDIMLTAIWDTNPAPEASPPPTHTGPRRNPQTSPLQVSLTIFIAVAMIGAGFTCILKLTGKQSTATSKYNADMKRYVREMRMVIRGRRKK